jgi:hypothetical protein
VTYPLFYPKEPFDIEFAQKLSEFGRRTAADVGIPSKYIPGELGERPVSELFEIDSIARAPIGWFDNARYSVCPLDAAFCIVKVHEALSVMAALRVTSETECAAVRDFCDQMPGFDDIFEIWLALVAVVGDLDPRGLLMFIERYNTLPGFTARINVAVAYVEAALTHLACGDEVDL